VMISLAAFRVLLMVLLRALRVSEVVSDEEGEGEIATLSTE
jgi:hypothetical protein